MALTRAGPARPVVLVLRALGLGDLLTAVPALRGLARAYPGHRLVLAMPSSLGALVPLIGGVDEVLDVRGPGPVPCVRPEVAVNLHGRGPQSTEALCRTRPGRLISHGHPDLPEVSGPAWESEGHEVRRWCALLEWYGVAADPGDLALRSPGGDPGREGAVVIHPGAAARARRWPPERFGRVASALRRAGHRVVVTGNAAEEAAARQVAGLAGLPAEDVLAGRTGLAELAVLVGGARLVICGDTGVAHLATALGAPSVVIFGPVSPARWGPPRTRGRHVALWAGRTGDPHGDRPDPGLLEIGVRQVLGAAWELLEVGT